MIPRTLALVSMHLAFLFALANFLPAAAQQPATLHWSACPDVPDTECAGLDVPVDSARPDGAKLTLRLGRVPANDQAHKKGVLLIIPGGPGPGIKEEIGGEMRTAQHVGDFRRDYDVVTFDPRGIGQSNPIRCAPDAVPPASAPSGRRPSPAEFKGSADANAAFFRSCFAATGELMAHLSAIDTAADIELIRQALTPNDGLVAYAASYGSAYGQAYLERYGEHVKAMVLDGVVDHGIDMPAFAARNVLAANDAFDRFTQWCGLDGACALHGQNPGSVFDAVVAKVPAARALVSQLLAAGTDPHVGWPAIAKMLGEVNAGQTAALEALTGTASLASSSEDPSVRAGKNGLFPGVMCADYGPQRDYDALLTVGKVVEREAPRFAWKFWDATPLAHATLGVGDCAGWPLEARNPPHQLQVGPHPNVMVANPTHDPATPLANALAVWLQIPQARLLIADVDGHQSLPLSDCAFKAEARFLGDPAAASSVTLCPD